MTSLSVSDLSYSIGVTPILTDVSFSIEDGDKLGIVGVNGAGKTTLLRLITGEIDADTGNVFISQNKRVGILKQNDAVTILEETGLTVLEYMYRAFPELISYEKRISELESLLSNASSEEISGLTAEYDRVFNAFKNGGGLEYKSRSEGLLLKLGFEKSQFDFKVANLSGGQRTRLNLARLLFAEPEILILDEPTNHLDFDTMQWLEGILSNYKKTLIVVSHDRYFLDHTTNKTLDIENQKATLYKGSYSTFVELKKEKRKSDEKAYQLQQKEIARLEAFIEQQRRWNREKNIIAAESREKAIARMDKVEKPENAPQSIRFTFDSALESGNDVLSVKNLKMAFSGKTVFENISFEIKKREKTFIVGRNGCGKSTLLKILQGYLKPVSGNAEFGYNVRIGYYDQENQNLDYSKNVLDELWDCAPQMSQTDVRKTLAAFMFRGDDVAKKVGILSGGEKARLTIAKLILSKMNVLILDEPTNHLDIPSREALENALSAFDGTIIAVSHDRYFINKLATRVIDISDGLHDFKSGYKEYEEYKSERNELIKISETTSDNKQKYLDKKAEDARKRKLESDKVKVSAKIEKLENEIEDITKELFGEAAYDYVKAAELDKIKNEKEEELLLLYEEKEKLYEQN